MYKLKYLKYKQKYLDLKYGGCKNKDSLVKTPSTNTSNPEIDLSTNKSDAIVTRSDTGHIETLGHIETPSTIHSLKMTGKTFPRTSPRTSPRIITPRTSPRITTPRITTPRIITPRTSESITMISGPNTENIEKGQGIFGPDATITNFLPVSPSGDIVDDIETPELSTDEQISEYCSINNYEFYKYGLDTVDGYKDYKNTDELDRAYDLYYSIYGFGKLDYYVEILKDEYFRRRVPAHITPELKRHISTGTRIKPNLYDLYYFLLKACAPVQIMNFFSRSTDFKFLNYNFCPILTPKNNYFLKYVYEHKIVVSDIIILLRDNDIEIGHISIHGINIGRLQANKEFQTVSRTLEGIIHFKHIFRMDGKSFSFVLPLVYSPIDKNNFDLIWGQSINSNEYFKKMRTLTHDPLFEDRFNKMMRDFIESLNKIKHKIFEKPGTI
jgi:hypothetical protein